MEDEWREEREKLWERKKESVCVREKEGEREREGGREEREREKREGERAWEKWRLREREEWVRGCQLVLASHILWITSKHSKKTYLTRIWTFSWTCRDFTYFQSFITNTILLLTFGITEAVKMNVETPSAKVEYFPGMQTCYWKWSITSMLLSEHLLENILLKDLMTPHP